MKSISVTAALLTACAGCAGAPAELCRAPETTWFACGVARERSVALCGPLGGTPEYRFGRRNAIDLRYPPVGLRGPLYFAHYSRYQTDRTEIRFVNQGVDYVLFDDLEGGRRRAGVRVTTPDAREREMVCTGRVTSRLQELANLLPCDADSALNGGACR